MKFRTEIEIPELSCKLNYTTKALFIGSCFTLNIGAYLQCYKFAVDINPFGVIYNPASVINSLQLLLDNKYFNENDLNYENGLWFSYTHHSSFSSPNKDECLEQINNRIKESASFFRQTDFLFITLGTAYAYKFKQSNTVVANCHKTTANAFERILLTPETIVSNFSELFNSLFSLNPNLKIVFSISPVRHLKDSAHGNQISKACLLLAVDELNNKYNSNCFYFPAYELLLDDLRDYRFYSDDMCHPSAQAIKYIWEKFRQSVIGNECEPIMKQIDAIITACNHRPFNANTAQHKEFKQKIMDKINILKKQYPFMDFTKESEIINYM